MKKFNLLIKSSKMGYEKKLKKSRKIYATFKVEMFN